VLVVPRIQRPATSTCTLLHVRSLLTDDVAQTVACSIVDSRLDYCNVLLSDAPAATFDKLQCTQNNLARVVCQSRGRTDARPLLHSLLPVRQQVTPRALRSSDALLLVFPRIHTELACRAFAVAAPSTCNIRLCENILTFKHPSVQTELSPPVLHQALLYLQT